MQHIWPEVIWRKARRHSDTRLGSASNTPEVEHISGLFTISAGQAEVIALAYFGGQTYAEVAAALNLSLPAVKARIRDGFRNLRHSLGPAGTD